MASAEEFPEIFGNRKRSRFDVEPEYDQPAPAEEVNPANFATAQEPQLTAGFMATPSPVKKDDNKTVKSAAAVELYNFYQSLVQQKSNKAEKVDDRDNNTSQSKGANSVSNFTDIENRKSSSGCVSNFANQSSFEAQTSTGGHPMLT